MNRRMRRIRTVLLLSAAVTIALVMVGAQAAEMLNRADLSSVNWRFSVRGTETPPPIVVVSIEDRTITGTDAEGNLRTWPMNRRRHAKVVDELHEAGAKVIAYDVQFTEPSGDTEEDFEADNALIEAVRAAAPTVVMATTEVGEKGETSIFGGGEGLEYSKATPGELQLRGGRRRPDPPYALQDRRAARRSRSSPRRRCSAAGSRDPPKAIGPGSTTRGRRERSSTSPSTTSRMIG